VVSAAAVGVASAAGAAAGSAAGAGAASAAGSATFSATSIGVSVTCSGLGLRSLSAPLVASIPIPIRPPAMTLPAMPAAPAPLSSEAIEVLESWKPFLLTVMSKASLRGMLKVQGVEAQLKPLDVSTFAPGGVDSTLNSVVVPRVTVAQAESADIAKAAAIKRITNFMETPPRVEARA
jgi:hypothetical protein